jgi:N-acetylmuramoyl-L-alanine amidase
MAKTYVVKQGDYLAKIAHRHGFAKWQTIYDHPKNAALKQLRPNPNVLLPGDEVFIPDAPQNRAAVAPNSTTKFRAQRPTALVRIALKDEQGNAVSIDRYELELGERTYPASKAKGGAVAKALGQGLIEQKVEPDAGLGRLRIWKNGGEDPDYEIDLRVGDLDPADQVSGAQARLLHLGLDCGPVDGVLGPKTQRALQVFQHRNGLQVTGELDQATIDKLKSAHGC